MKIISDTVLVKTLRQRLHALDVVLDGGGAFRLRFQSAFALFIEAAVDVIHAQHDCRDGRSARRDIPGIPAHGPCGGIAGEDSVDGFHLLFRKRGQIEQRDFRVVVHLVVMLSPMKQTRRRSGSTARCPPSAAATRNNDRP